MDIDYAGLLMYTPGTRTLADLSPEERQAFERDVAERIAPILAKMAAAQVAITGQTDR